MKYPSEYRYHKEHAWLLVEEDGQAVIGVSDFAQDTLGDIVEINCPPLGSMLSKGVACGSLESRKTVSDFISPVNGVVIEVNEGLSSEPFLVNDDPYKRGWIARVKISNPSDLADELMSAEAYQAEVGD